MNTYNYKIELKSDDINLDSIADYIHQRMVEFDLLNSKLTVVIWKNQFEYSADPKFIGTQACYLPMPHELHVPIELIDTEIFIHEIGHAAFENTMFKFPDERFKLLSFNWNYYKFIHEFIAHMYQSRFVFNKYRMENALNFKLNFHYDSFVKYSDTLATVMANLTVVNRYPKKSIKSCNKIRTSTFINLLRECRKIHHDFVLGKPMSFDKSIELFKCVEHEYYNWKSL